MTDPLASDPLLDPKLTGTTDGAAGETVLPGTPGGPQGGEPAEATPDYRENDLSGEDLDLDDADGGLGDGDTELVAGEENQADDALEADDIRSIEAIGE
jgi:hypothetical protein